MRRRFSEQMAKDLALTPTQQVRVDSVLTRQMDAIRRATEAVRPTTDSITREAQAAIDSILSPEQRAKIRSFRGRMGSPPPGGPNSRG
jgi:Spy/CpxP family protein refolding chaperone